MQYIADHLTYEPVEGRWTLSIQLPRTRQGITIAHAEPSVPSLEAFVEKGILDGTLVAGDTLAYAPHVVSEPVTDPDPEPEPAVAPPPADEPVGG